MAAMLKLSIITLVLALGLVAAKPEERERRFLLNSLVSGVKRIAGGITGIFKEKEPPKLPLKDENAALAKATLIKGLANLLKVQGDFLTRKGQGLRASNRNQSDPNKDEWKTAADRVTRLGADLVVNRNSFATAEDWVKSYTSDNELDALLPKDLIIIGNAIRSHIDRIQASLPEVKRALTKLRDVAGTSATADINLLLSKVRSVETFLGKMETLNEEFVKAVGFDD